jgi:hypothetical protein
MTTGHPWRMPRPRRTPIATAADGRTPGFSHLPRVAVTVAAVF